MGELTHLNPDGMHRSPAFSQGIAVSGPARTIYVGGQNGVGADGQVVGDDLATQTERALRNVEAVLLDAGAGIDDLVSLTIVIAQGQDPLVGFEAYSKTWGMIENPPVISVTIAAALGQPAFLVEISAIAVTD